MINRIHGYDANTAAKILFIATYSYDPAIRPPSPSPRNLITTNPTPNKGLNDRPPSAARPLPPTKQKYTYNVKIQHYHILHAPCKTNLRSLRFSSE